MESKSHLSQTVNHLHIRHSGLTHLPTAGMSFCIAKYSHYLVPVMGKKHSVNGQDWLWATWVSLTSPNSPNWHFFHLSSRLYTNRVKTFLE